MLTLQLANTQQNQIHPECSSVSYNDFPKHAPHMALQNTSFPESHGQGLTRFCKSTLGRGVVENAVLYSFFQILTEPQSGCVNETECLNERCL